MALAYISIGSNLGNRLAYLQKGIDACSERIGTVCVISAVVETPAVGFDGNPFLNACFSMETTLGAPKLMQELLAIEIHHGRTRSKAVGYQNRTLDLDLLFYDDLVVTDETLTLPHPSMQKRRFVLQPLNEIAPNKEHPILKKVTTLLLAECKDNSVLSTTEHALLHPLYANIKQHDFICIEGIIGSGKTTLAKTLAAKLGYKTLQERFADNPFLPKFYRKPKRFAFPLELSFLADRFKQINEEAEQLDLFQSGVVSDYHMSKSLVFAQNTLSNDEYPLFKQLFELMSRNANQPSLCIYLRQTPIRAKANIKKRGRSYEQQIEMEYLEKLAASYDQHVPFLRTQMNVVEVDVSDLDFVLHPDDLDELLRRVNAQLDANA
ncbi:MAG: Deoxyguanosine kinase [Bacteroidota bacterium]|nr:MAG: Deoxyguanosine kinase [Bacteroidota bacterium]